MDQRRSRYLAAGQVQGSVPVLIQQCQVSLGPVKEDGWRTQRHSCPLNTGSGGPILSPPAPKRPGSALTYGATVTLISSDHQGRTSTSVHRVDLCPVAKHQLKACHVLGERGSMQRGPAWKSRGDIPVSRDVATSRPSEQWDRKGKTLFRP